MAIITFDKDAIIEYVPEYAGNRASDNPCIVRVRPVTHARVNQYSRQIAAKNKGSQEPGRFLEAAHGIQKKQFCENVESISGFFIGEKEIMTAEELYDVADRDLVSEIIGAMESSAKLREGQRKN